MRPPRTTTRSRSLYTLVRRDEDGALVAVPYHEAFAEQHAAAAAKLCEAAELASDPGLATYLRLRADALESDDYQPSDMAWLDMKENPIEVVIGPIEAYEDLLFGAKTIAINLPAGSYSRPFRSPPPSPSRAHRPGTPPTTGRACSPGGPPRDRRPTCARSGSATGAGTRP